MVANLNSSFAQDVSSNLEQPNGILTLKPTAIGEATLTLQTQWYPKMWIHQAVNNHSQCQLNETEPKPTIKMLPIILNIPFRCRQLIKHVAPPALPVLKTMGIFFPAPRDRHQPLSRHSVRYLNHPPEIALKLQKWMKRRRTKLVTVWLRKQRISIPCLHVAWVQPIGLFLGLTRIPSHLSHLKDEYALHSHWPPILTTFQATGNGQRTRWPWRKLWAAKEKKADCGFNGSPAEHSEHEEEQGKGEKMIFGSINCITVALPSFYLPNVLQWIWWHLVITTMAEY
jgi:hypothetical protein